MTQKIRNLLLVIALGLACISSAVAAPSDPFIASFGIRAGGGLDQDAIAKAYKDGEWEPIVGSLQSYLRQERENGIPVTDRIFAYKYLGVILSADSASHAKAESYFTRLLELSPTVEIVDLIPSNRVAEFFAKIKDDFQKRKQYTQNFDVYGYATEPDSSSPPQTAKAGSDKSTKSTTSRNRPTIQQKKDRGWLWWTVGLTTAIGAGIGVYYFANQTPSKKINRNLVEPQ